MSSTNRWLPVTIVMSSVLVSVVIAELLLRVLGIGYGNAPLEASRTLHHVHPANYSFRVHDPAGEYGEFSVVYDDRRYRVPDDSVSKSQSPGQRRVVFLGDSFTEATQVAWSDSFVGKLGADQEFIVQNMGVSSYSPLYFLVQLKMELGDLSNADVVVQLFENDFSSDNEMLLKANTTDLQRVERIDGGESALNIDLLRHSYVARLVRKVQLQIQYLLDPASQTVGFRDDQDAGGGSAQYADQRVLTYKILEKIKVLCEDRSITLHLMMIPNKALSRSNACCEKDWLQEEVRAFARKNNIDFIDLGLAFGSAESQAELFFARDIHLTEAGHDVVYRAVRAHLLNN